MLKSLKKVLIKVNFNSYFTQKVLKKAFEKVKLLKKVNSQKK